MVSAPQDTPAGLDPLTVANLEFSKGEAALMGTGRCTPRRRQGSQIVARSTLGMLVSWDMGSLSEVSIGKTSMDTVHWILGTPLRDGTGPSLMSQGAVDLRSMTPAMSLQVKAMLATWMRRNSEAPSLTDTALAMMLICVESLTLAATSMLL